MTSPGQRLRATYAEAPIMMPGAFNALAAKQVESLGFRAVYLSGGALSAGWAGLPDVGLLTADEFASQAAVMVRATNLPVLADADTGFGEAINVARTVRLYEQAGVAGLHLEDQVLPKRCGHLSGKALIDADAMCAKIRAAVSARRDPSFVIVARTDARNVESFDDAVRRALAYIDAGADAIFPEALESLDEFAHFALQVPSTLVANMTEFGRSPLIDFHTLADLGYRIVLYPLTALRVAMKAAEVALRTLRDEGSQRSFVDRMQTRAELYDLIDYYGWERADERYFRGSPPES